MRAVFIAGRAQDSRAVDFRPAEQRQGDASHPSHRRVIRASVVGLIALVVASVLWCAAPADADSVVRGRNRAGWASRPSRSGYQPRPQASRDLSSRPSNPSWVPSPSFSPTPDPSTGIRYLYETIPGPSADRQPTVETPLPLAPATPLAEIERIEGKHPAVVRVNAPAGDGSTFHGTGTMVAMNDRLAVIVTNWHVVRDLRGIASVRFPNGYRAKAQLIGKDTVWDLAALLIRRPTGVEPVPVSPSVPAMGSQLTIAGYGSGRYRESSGRVVKLLAPSRRDPHEVLEITTSARFGDSGGPILTQDGRLAGVLFGSASGRTNGSHCLRVKRFLESAIDRAPDWVGVLPVAGFEANESKSQVEEQEAVETADDASSR